MREAYCLVVSSVCLSVPALAASESVETSKQRYSRVSLLGGLQRLAAGATGVKQARSG